MKTMNDNKTTEELSKSLRSPILSFINREIQKETITKSTI